MGIVQGLTEFLPVSSSGHLIIVPFLFGWNDPFITSLAFSVMLHIGTLVALLVYFRADWLRLVPAGLRHDPRSLVRGLTPTGASPGCSSRRRSRPRSPGFLLNDVIETASATIGLVAVDARRRRRRSCGSRIAGARATKGVEDVTFPIAFGIGAAQALALVPGISRSGISISAARLAGLDREAAARFAFLMATPITAGAALFEIRKLRPARPASTSASARWSSAWSPRSWPG